MPSQNQNWGYGGMIDVGIRQTPWQHQQLQEVGLPDLTGMQGGQQFGLGDFGNSLASLLPGGQPSAGLGGIAKIGGSLLKGVGTKLAGSVLGKAAMANPIGAVLGGIQMIAGISGKTKEAQRQSAAYDRQIESSGESITAAKELTDASKEVAEEDRDIGFQTAGVKDERTLDAIYKKGGQARAATGGLVSGEVESDIAQAESDVLEGGMITQETLARGYDRSIAMADAQFESFEDKARKQIEELKRARGNLKTKWYQNIV